MKTVNTALKLAAICAAALLSNVAFAQTSVTYKFTGAAVPELEVRLGETDVCVINAAAPSCTVNVQANEPTNIRIKETNTFLLGHINTIYRATALWEDGKSYEYEIAPFVENRSRSDRWASTSTMAGGLIGWGLSSLVASVADTNSPEAPVAKRPIIGNGITKMIMIPVAYDIYTDSK